MFCHSERDLSEVHDENVKNHWLRFVSCLCCARCFSLKLDMSSVGKCSSLWFFLSRQKKQVLFYNELGLSRVGVNFCWDFSRWKKNKFVWEHAEQKFTLGKIELEYRWTPVSQASEFSKEALPSQLWVHTWARKMDVHKCCLSAIAYPKLGT